MTKKKKSYKTNTKFKKEKQLESVELIRLNKLLIYTERKKEKKKKSNIKIESL